ncbi:MAG: glucose-6-phosphate dehydrogenase [Candidatus Gracilibacteria bacterium]|nr:glucose-6-phosphate dehydrogenase [Candidatus Gracilibacteria bacterium]
MKLYREKNPLVFTIFGASGDLAKIKIFPALYALAEQKRFPKEFYIYGFSRSKITHEEFRKSVRKSVQNKSENPIDEKLLENLLKKVYYFSGLYDNSESFEKFSMEIMKRTNNKKITNIAYLAVPPIVFEPIVELLSGIKKKIGQDLRLIIEKPFGHDEESAEKLYHHVSTFFDLEKVYLLDHYLGKDQVQSLLVLRYSNSILNTLLNGKLISNIQITASEDLSVANRISYFDQVGIIKDMIQSHLLQLLALLTMELPVSQEAKSIHREKYAVLSALKLRGYDKGIVVGQHESYKKIKGVKQESTTPTFAGVRLFIDRQEWYHVPIYIRTGKMLKKKHTYVVVEFEKLPFQKNKKDVDTNKLIIELQPDAKLHLKLFTKHGGIKSELHDLTTSESIACYGDDCLPEHGRLFVDVFKEDHSNFLSFEEIIATWRFTDKILKFIKKKNIKPSVYKDYSDGPKEQHILTDNDNLEWLEVDLQKNE